MVFHVPDANHEREVLIWWKSKSFHFVHLLPLSAQLPGAACWITPPRLDSAAADLLVMSTMVQLAATVLILIRVSVLVIMPSIQFVFCVDVDFNDISKISKLLLFTVKFLISGMILWIRTLPWKGCNWMHFWCVLVIQVFNQVQVWMHFWCHSSFQPSSSPSSPQMKTLGGEFSRHISHR